MKATLALLAAIVAASPTMAEPLTIRVGWSSMPGHMIPVLFTHPDILRHYGVSYTVEPINFRGSSTQITAMAAREVDLAAFSPGTLALTVLNAHVDTRVIGDIIQDGIPGYRSDMFLVRADGGIKTVADLKGKLIGINARGSSADMAMRSMMKKSGLTEPRDFTTIEAAFPSLPALLEEGKVDLASILMPQQDVMLHSGHYRELFDMKDGWGPSQIVFLAGRADFIEKNRAAMSDFMEDYVRAFRWFEDPSHHAQAVAIIARFMKTSPADLDYVFTAEDYYRDPFARPNIANLQSAMNTAKDLGVIGGAIQVEPKYVDYSFTDEARRRIEAAP